MIDVATWRENNDRPAWVQANREQLVEQTGVHVPSRRSAISEWLDTHKGVVTRKLTDDGDTEDSNDAN